MKADFTPDFEPKTCGHLRENLICDPSPTPHPPKKQQLPLNGNFCHKEGEKLLHDLKLYLIVVFIFN